MVSDSTLRDLIVVRIRQQGPISFHDFMAEALYHPGLGYYASPSTEIGIKGDFFTSSHLHPAFGAMVGKQIEEMWRFTGKPADFTIMEFGGGRGYLAADMLQYLEGGEFFDALTYVIVEPNPYLKSKQESLLSRFNRKLNDKVAWVTSLSGFRTFTGCVFSNELIDAFPVHLVKIEGGSVKEVFLDENFNELLMPACEKITGYLEQFVPPLPDGYTTEVNLDGLGWMEGVSAAMSTGFIFTIDYGYPAYDYYCPHRHQGTLLCYYRHEVSDNPYQRVGLQDITAHVNFSALKKWGEDLGFKTVGYCPQGTFLISMRIDEFLSRLTEQEDYPFEALKIKRLLLPEGMGESHKVLIQYKGDGTPVLSGFSMRNVANTLD